MGEGQRDSSLGMSYIGRTKTAFHKSLMKRLTTAEVGCRLVVTNNKASSVFFLEKRNNPNFISILITFLKVIE